VRSHSIETGVDVFAIQDVAETHARVLVELDRLEHYHQFVRPGFLPYDPSPYLLLICFDSTTQCGYHLG